MNKEWKRLDNRYHSNEDRTLEIGERDEEDEEREKEKGIKKILNKKCSRNKEHKEIWKIRTKSCKIMVKYIDHIKSSAKN